MAIHSLTDPGQVGHLKGDVAGLYITAGVLTLLVRRLETEGGGRVTTPSGATARA